MALQNQRAELDQTPWLMKTHLYLASMDHYLYALDLNYDTSSLEVDEAGSRTLVAEPLWSLDLGAAVAANPVLVDGVIYAGTIDGTLYAVDLETTNGALVI